VYEDLEKNDTVVIAISQEDTDLKSAKKFMKLFKGKTPPFAIAADLNRKSTTQYDRTTTYFIDKSGVVRQVFPMQISHRASWKSIVNEINRLSDNG
jgi:peroxiredoxin